MNKVAALIKEYKLLTGGLVALPLALVIIIFSPSPRDIVYADLDKRYAMNDQVQQQIQSSTTNILLEFKQSKLEDIKREIYFLDKLKAQQRATPDDIARLNQLIRARDDLINEINSMKSPH